MPRFSLVRIVPRLSMPTVKMIEPAAETDRSLRPRGRALQVPELFAVHPIGVDGGEMTFLGDVARLLPIVLTDVGIDSFCYEHGLSVDWPAYDFLDMPRWVGVGE